MCYACKFGPDQTGKSKRNREDAEQHLIVITFGNNCCIAIQGIIGLAALCTWIGS